MLDNAKEIARELREKANQYYSTPGKSWALLVDAANLIEAQGEAIERAKEALIRCKSFLITLDDSDLMQRSGGRNLRHEWKCVERDLNDDLARLSTK